MSDSAPAYRPEPEGLHAEFFRLAAATGRLHIQRCDACGRLRHPPRHFCPSCFSPVWSFAPVDGRGTVHSAVVVHRAFGPPPRGEVPYAAVVVDLDAGPRVLGTGQGAPPSAFTIGSPVRIDIEPVGDNFAAFGVVLDPR